MEKIEVIHIGPQKSATTWLFQCIESHPEISVAQQDSIHYFDMFFHRGSEWYFDCFQGKGFNKKRVDMTPSYLRSNNAALRISEYNPDMKIALCLRNPIERAFSHYWHEKSRGNISYTFSDCLSNYDLFQSWIETGFYAQHISRYKEHFPSENILIQDFDNLKKDPSLFLKEFLKFIGVSEKHSPPILNKKANVAKSIRNSKIQKVKSGLKEKWFMKKLVSLKGKLREKGFIGDNSELSKIEKSKIEKLGNEDALFKKELLMIYSEEIDKLELLTNKNFDHWKTIC